MEDESPQTVADVNTPHTLHAKDEERLIQRVQQLWLLTGTQVQSSKLLPALQSLEQWRNVTAADVNKARSKAAKRLAAKVAIKPAKQSTLQRRCWGCNMAEGPVAFQECSLCVRQRLCPSYFCTRACQRDTHKHHTLWHERILKEIEEESPNFDQVIRERADRIPDPIFENLMQRDFRRAAKQLQKIAVATEDPEQYHTLGLTLCYSGNRTDGTRMLLTAMARYLPGTSEWVETLLHCFYKLCYKTMAFHNGSSVSAVGHLQIHTPMPEWWSDDGLKSLSKQALDAVSTDSVLLVHALQLRFLILHPHGWYGSRGDPIPTGSFCMPWEPGDRSVSESIEAIRCAERCFELLQTMGDTTARSSIFQAHGQTLRALVQEVLHGAASSVPQLIDVRAQQRNADKKSEMKAARCIQRQFRVLSDKPQPSSISKTPVAPKRGGRPGDYSADTWVVLTAASLFSYTPGNPDEDKKFEWRQDPVYW